MRIRLIYGLFAAGVFVLSGCAVWDELNDGQGARKPAPTAATSTPVAAVPASRDGSPAATRSVAETMPRPKRKPDIVDPRTLVGLDKQAVSALFGEPHRITLAQPALVWTWQTEDCEMRLFFYPDVADRKFRALAYQINATDVKHKGVVQDTCASRLKWAHAEAAR